MCSREFKLCLIEILKKEEKEQERRIKRTRKKNKIKLLIKNISNENMDVGKHPNTVKQLHADSHVVKHLIICLEELKEKECPLLSHILDYDLLISSLEELDNMVEMYEVKNSIVSQIKFLLVNTIDIENTEDIEKTEKRKKGNFDDHMLHTVLCGPPGCGKSKMGVILAQIWTSLGLLKKTEKKVSKKNKKDEYIKKLNLSLEIKTETLKKLEKELAEIKHDLGSNDYKLNLFRIRSLKRELEKMKNKDFSYITCMKLIDEIKREEEIFKLKSEKILYPKEPEFTFSRENIYNFDKIIKKIKQIPVEQEFIPVSEETEPKEESLEPKQTNDLIRIVSREDFVAGFLGQTAIKTEKLLQESLGKVLFIDEAYSLINDEKDAYGYECLTTLNRFMSEHSSEIVIIFAGYKDLLEKTIFKAQPGLKRRCTWHFEITGYTEKGLSQIFESQLENNEWLLDTDVNIEDFFKTNLNEFPYFGGDTLKLVFYCKICYSKEVFDNRHPNHKVINKKILEEALSYLKNYRILEVESKTPHGMYI